MEDFKTVEQLIKADIAEQLGEVEEVIKETWEEFYNRLESENKLNWLAQVNGFTAPNLVEFRKEAHADCSPECSLR